MTSLDLINDKRAHGTNAVECAHLLRAWAAAYRASPEHRFPSDPHAEFFPVDLETAAAEIDRLRAEKEDFRKKWFAALPSAD